MSLAKIISRDPLPDDADIFTQHEEINSIASFIESAAKIVPIESSKARNMKAKLFQFHGNRRPQYYGTWRKKSKIVSGSCPLAEEIGIDYNVVSDDEWEDEPSDGEECNSDDDAEKDNDDDDGGEEDDGFFVPPCYLSDGEGDEDSTSDNDIAGDKKKEKQPKRITIDSDDDENSTDAAERKARLAQRAEDWAKRTGKKELAMKPRAVGPVFNNCDDQPEEFKFMIAVKFY